jgi:hypothetical protein
LTKLKLTVNGYSHSLANGLVTRAWSLIGGTDICPR